MGKPWEKNWGGGVQASSPQPTGSPAPKPWEKNWSKPQDPNAPIPDDKIIQEQAPEVSWTDRLKTKNFSNGDDTTLKYYKDKNPGADVRMQNGQVLVRPLGETNYRVDDPNAPMIGPALKGNGGEALKNLWTNVKDIPADVGDIAYDVGDGIANGLSTAGGAIAGAFGGTAVAPGPGTIAGGIAGGSLASGAESAASEAARQKIGQQLGLPQEVNGSDVALSGGVGMLTPLAFGMGSEAKSVAKAALGGQEVNQLLRKAAGMDAAKELLSKRAALEAGESLNRGAVQRGYNAATRTVAPMIAGAASGKGMQAIRELGQHMPYIDDLAGRKNGLAEEVSGLSEKLGHQVSSHVNDAGRAVGKEVDAVGIPLETSSVRQPFIDKIQDAETLVAQDPSPVNQTILDKLKGTYEDLFGGLPDQTTGTVLMNKKQQLKPLMDLSPRVQGVTTSKGTAVSELPVTQAANGAYGAVKDIFDKATGGRIPELNKNYIEALSLQQNLKPSFGNPKQTFSTLSKLDKPSNMQAKAALDQAESVGVPAASQMQKLRAAIPWVDPEAVSMRQIPLGAAGATAGFYAGSHSDMGPGGGTLGAGAGLLAGGLLGSPRAMKTAVKMGLGMERGGRTIRDMVPTADIPGGRNATVKSLYDILAGH